MGKLAERQLETSSKQVEFSTDGFAVRQFHSPIRNPEASLLEAFRNQRKNCTELRVILLQEVLLHIRRLPGCFCSTEFRQWNTRSFLLPGNPLCFQPEHPPPLCPAACKYLGSSAVHWWSCVWVLEEDTDLFSSHPAEHPPALWGAALSTWKTAQGKRGKLWPLCFLRELRLLMNY